MTIKDSIKMVITHFFVITTAVLFVMSLRNAIDGIKAYPADYPWVILATGALTALPSFLLYFKREPNTAQFCIRLAMHFVVIELIVMTEGYILGWYDSFLEGVIVFLMILAVYVIVFTYSYAIHWNTANSINKALKEINESEEA